MFHEENLNALTGYFASGCKREQLLGVELEHFVIESGTRRSLFFETGVEEILTSLQPFFGAPIFSQGRVIGISSAGAEISLEPAAQLEISIHPTACISEIKNTYDDFLAAISPILRKKNAELFCAGYHPRSKIADLPLIPKKRYEYMYNYFKKTGTHGAHMMKGTAAAQINIDYESEADFSKKFRVANALSPIFSLMCDNAPVFENAPHPARMLRAFIWNNVDPARSGIVPGACDGDFGFRDYAEYIYGLPPIFMPRGSSAIFTGSAPVSEIFAQKKLTQAEIEHVTSMAFPDVRLKNRIEIRMADSMPIEKTLEFTALVKKIFYDKKNLDYFFEELRAIKNHDIAEAKAALIARGANAKIYHKPAKDWLDELSKK